MRYEDDLPFVVHGFFICSVALVAEALGAKSGRRIRACVIASRLSLLILGRMIFITFCCQKLSKIFSIELFFHQTICGCILWGVVRLHNIVVSYKGCVVALHIM